ncbi:DUF3757 domain-containing protein [Pseudomonas sp. SWRI154]|uniref:DUF3757 domain-containing protein n=1 Tax=Pseudomonas sp. SWRI154 TaxID=2745501 RepID=UPI001646C127|nr:DUF3757 domain-containing protein [Pseudomonas sp. SWRI154]MBC3364964.1 DUF3757 domain-containing protein [Pseudomonas sp. SWRI154]
MLNKWALGAGLLVGMTGQIYAGQITCPAAADIQRRIEVLEDVFFVDEPNDLDWQSQSLVNAVNPALLVFNGAEYVIHGHEDDHQQLTTRTTFTCKYGEINLILKDVQMQVPSFSPWANNRCESLDVHSCELINADYFQVILE